MSLIHLGISACVSFLYIFSQLLYTGQVFLFWLDSCVLLLANLVFYCLTCISGTCRKDKALFHSEVLFTVHLKRQLLSSVVVFHPLLLFPFYYLYLTFIFSSFLVVFSFFPLGHHPLLFSL